MQTYDIIDVFLSCLCFVCLSELSVLEMLGSRELLLRFGRVVGEMVMTCGGWVGVWCVCSLYCTALVVCLSSFNAR